MTEATRRWATERRTTVVTRGVTLADAEPAVVVDDPAEALEILAERAVDDDEADDDEGGD
jgi:hypothetical protein